MRIINNEVLRKNIQSILKTNAVMLVVKDNAYGFGICNVVNIAKAMHVRDFAVKSVSEGTFIKMINFSLFGLGSRLLLFHRKPVTPI